MTPFDKQLPLYFDTNVSEVFINTVHLQRTSQYLDLEGITHIRNYPINCDCYRIDTTVVD